MKRYQITNGIETIEIESVNEATFNIYPKVVEQYPLFIWENITITEI